MNKSGNRTVEVVDFYKAAATRVFALSEIAQEHDQGAAHTNPYANPYTNPYANPFLPRFASINNIKLPAPAPNLSTLAPAFCASPVLTLPQAICLIFLMLGLLLWAWHDIDQFTLFWSIVLTGFYLILVLLRSWILAHYQPGSYFTKRFAKSARALPPSYGHYAVLVPLYKEYSQLPELIAALDRLIWPQHKKKIYLICEEDDLKTLSYFDEHALPGDFSLVVVPRGTPRTKPRALNYCLRFVKADFVVIYDAEDRPSPTQLIEAYRSFSASNDATACLQAPLVIDNLKLSFLERMFAIEYDTLFYGLLPALTQMGAPIPLGGTSNHFRFEALVQIGAWDAFNVTEDADLGIRLARAGYRCDVLRQPTYEEAPSSMRPWMAQRIRWIKGWLQTILVHSRSPAKTFNDLSRRQFGRYNYLLFHLLLSAQVFSSLTHPFFLMLGCWHLYQIANGMMAFDVNSLIFMIGMFNLVAAYASYGFLAKIVMNDLGRKTSRFWILALPIYWILISLAAWLAVYELVTNPHHWHKTPHGRVKRKSRPAYTD